MSFVRQFLIWFFSALCVSAGAKAAHFLTRYLTAWNATEPVAPGSPSQVLCPRCGRAMRRVRQSLICQPCGHKEEPTPAS